MTYKLIDYDETTDKSLIETINELVFLYYNKVFVEPISKQYTDDPYYDYYDITYR